MTLIIVGWRRSLASILPPMFYSAQPGVMMKRHLTASVVALASLALVACPGPELYVEAAIDEMETGEALPLAELPIRLIPFDRDAIFDSLTAAAPEPEPEIPQDLVERQNQIRDAEQEWREAETAWNQARSRLREIGEETQRMQEEGLRGTPQYQQRFREFEQLENREREMRQQMDQAFARFDTMQREVLEQADSIRAIREAWEDRAFADYNRIVQDTLDRLGREEISDTTDANGRVRFRPREGRWWVHSRYTLPYTELYWNVPVQVEGDSVGVLLNRQNAEERPLL